MSWGNITVVKTVYLLRHAKSSWDDPDLADHERPLAPRGERVTPRVAAHLRVEGLAPDAILCSSAVRTRQTLALLGDAVPAHAAVHVEDGLYAASAHTVLDRLRALPDNVEAPMVIGHNPGLQQLAILLAGSGPALGRLRRKFPTAALAVLRAPVRHWKDLAVDGAELVALVRPKDLGG